MLAKRTALRAFSLGLALTAIGFYGHSVSVFAAESGPYTHFPSRQPSHSLPLPAQPSATYPPANAQGAFQPIDNPLFETASLNNSTLVAQNTKSPQVPFLPQPHFAPGFGNEFQPVLADYSPRYGQADTVAPVVKTAPPVKGAGDAKKKNTAKKEAAKDANKDVPKAKPLNPLDYIDFDGMYHAVKDTTKKWGESAKTSTLKAGQATKSWFKSVFDEEHGEETQPDRHGQSLIPREPHDDQSAREMRSSFYINAVQAERAGEYAAAEEGYLKYLQSFQKSFPTGFPKERLPGTHRAHIHHRLAVVSWRQGKTAQAENYFRSAVEHSRRETFDMPLVTDFALFLQENGKHGQSEVLLKNALIAEPENERAKRFLGRSLVFQNRPEEALRYLSDIMDEKSAYREIASIYRLCGDENTARLAEAKINGPDAFHDNREEIANQLNGSLRGPRTLTSIAEVRDMQGMQTETGILPPKQPAWNSDAHASERTAGTPHRTRNTMPRTLSSSNGAGHADPFGAWIPARSPQAAPNTPIGWESALARHSPPESTTRVYHYSGGSHSQAYHYIPAGNNDTIPATAPTTVPKTATETMPVSYAQPHY